jgi:hypothetical protein
VATPPGSLPDAIVDVDDQLGVRRRDHVAPADQLEVAGEALIVIILRDE